MNIIIRNTKSSVVVVKRVIYNYHRRRQPPSSSFPMTTSLSNPTLFHRPNPKPNSTFFRYTQSLKFSTKSSSKDTNNNVTEQLQPSEKRSIGVATGELFLGIASRIIKRTNATRLDSDSKIRMFDDVNEELLSSKKQSSSSSKKDDEEIAEVVDNGDVVWEQRLKDVVAERRRKAVTSPGFSFSAAGLLFPYHLGVAKFLLEKGYIKVY